MMLASEGISYHRVCLSVCPPICYKSVFYWNG